MRTGLTISGTLLVLLMLGMLWLLERRARLNLQASGDDAPGPVKRLAAAAEHPDFVRSWVRPTVLCLVGLLGGQLLNIAGCNTNPSDRRSHVRTQRTCNGDGSEGCAVSDAESGDARAPTGLNADASVG